MIGGTIHIVETCPFCRIGIENSSFLESENFYAIYNIAPILKGHSLVVPKSHLESLLSLSDTQLNEFMAFSRKVTRLLMSAFHGKGFDWSIQEGPVAGQSVPHLHLHIVVRQAGDLEGKGEWYQLIRESEGSVLDSSIRPRISVDEYQFYTDFLRNEAALSGDNV